LVAISKSLAQKGCTKEDFAEQVGLCAFHQNIYVGSNAALKLF
jgi:hypothetical protein